MANSSTKVRLQTPIRLMYGFSYPAKTEFTFVTSGVLTLSEKERERHRVYFTGSCRYHPSDRPEASIKRTPHTHLWPCYCGVTLMCGRAEGVDGSGAKDDFIRDWSKPAPWRGGSYWSRAADSWLLTQVSSLSPRSSDQTQPGGNEERLPVVTL